MSWHRSTSWQVIDDAGRRKYLTDDERLRFLAAADKLPPRHRALCYTLAFTGCRISEVLNLRRFHVNESEQELIVRTLKRRKTIYRAVPIPRLLEEILLSLHCDEDERLWTMHRSTAWEIVKDVMRAARIRGPMACSRGLRHGYGVRAALRGVPPNLIQRWLGHSDGSTTAIYLDVVGREERQFVEKMWNAKPR